MPKQFPWTRNRALVLFEKLKVENPAEKYHELRKRWVGAEKIPPELKVHLVLGGALHQWLELLATCHLMEILNLKNQGTAHGDQTSASMSLLAHLATDTGAILSLCRAGYDVQARSLIRGIIERIDLLICCKLDEPFAAEYVAAGSFEESRDFFYRKITGGKLAKQAKKNFKTAFPENEEIHEWLFTEWRDETLLMLSAAVHTNHSISFISFFPNIGGKAGFDVGLNGRPSNISRRTISLLITAFMPLAHLFSSYPYLAFVEPLSKDGVDINELQGARYFEMLSVFFVLVNTWLKNPQIANELPLQECSASVDQFRNSGDSLLNP
ncbi:MAG: hypothetical protein AAGA36_10440 [Pseudomonadota bacterium]